MILDGREIGIGSAAILFGGNRVMRYTTCPVLGVLLAVVSGPTASAEETKAPWWHFGRDKDAPRGAGRPSARAAPNDYARDARASTPVEEESWVLAVDAQDELVRSRAPNRVATTEPFATSAPSLRDRHAPTAHALWQADASTRARETLGRTAGQHDDGRARVPRPGTR